MEWWYFVDLYNPYDGFNLIRVLDVAIILALLINQIGNQISYIIMQKCCHPFQLQGRVNSERKVICEINFNLLYGPKLYDIYIY